jgi:Domain of unknown function (DUF4386)
MTTRTIGRLGAAAGAAYVVLTFAGEALSGSGDSPALGSPPADYARWLADNTPTGAGYVGAFVALIGLLSFVVFAGALYDVLRRSERERTWLPITVLGAAVVSAAIKLGSAPPLLAAFSLRRGIDPQLAKALVEMNDYAFLLTWATDAVMLGAAAACALRTGALPRWLGVSAAVIAPLLLACVAGGNSAPPFGFLLALLWFLAAGIALARPGYAAVARSSVQPVSQS